MIRVRLTCLGGEFQKLNVSGHVAKNTGMSLVCNSVSVLTQTFEESVIRLVDKEAFEVINESGRSELIRNSKGLNAEHSHTLDSLLRSYIIGIQRIRSSFPEEIRFELMENEIVHIREKGVDHGT